MCLQYINYFLLCALIFYFIASNRDIFLIVMIDSAFLMNFGVKIKQDLHISKNFLINCIKIKM